MLAAQGILYAIEASYARRYHKEQCSYNAFCGNTWARPAVLDFLQDLPDAILFIRILEESAKNLCCPFVA